VNWLHRRDAEQPDVHEGSIADGTRFDKASVRVTREAKACEIVILE
jgi:hypothetical protein